MSGAEVKEECLIKSRIISIGHLTTNASLVFKNFPTFLTMSFHSIPFRASIKKDQVTGVYLFGLNPFLQDSL